MLLLFKMVIDQYLGETFSHNLDYHSLELNKSRMLNKTNG